MILPRPTQPLVFIVVCVACGGTATSAKDAGPDASECSSLFHGDTCSQAGLVCPQESAACWNYQPANVLCTCDGAHFQCTNDCPPHCPDPSSVTPGASCASVVNAIKEGTTCPLSACGGSASCACTGGVWVCDAPPVCDAGVD